MLQPNFKYHGRNSYAYLLANYGETKVSNIKMKKHTSIKDDDEGAVSNELKEKNEVRENENKNENVHVHVNEIDIDRYTNNDNNKSDNDGNNYENNDNDYSNNNVNKNVNDLNVFISEGEDIIVDTFDFITIQLYEGYSHTYFKTQILQESVTYVLHDLIKSLINGWIVDFSQDSQNFSTKLQENRKKDQNFQIIKTENNKNNENNKSCNENINSITSSSSLNPVLSLFQKRIFVKNSQLVIGLANGWAGEGKFLLLDPNEVKCSVLYCVVLYCIVLQCIVLVCIVLYYVIIIIVIMIIVIIIIVIIIIIIIIIYFRLNLLIIP